MYCIFLQFIFIQILLLYNILKYNLYFYFTFFHRFNIFKAFMDKIRRIFESLFGYNSSVSKFNLFIFFLFFEGGGLNKMDVYAYQLKCLRIKTFTETTKQHRTITKSVTYGLPLECDLIIILYVSESPPPLREILSR